MRWLVLCILAGLACGCTRAHYRRWADRECYQEIAERNQNPEWHLPYYNITPPPGSRLFDPFNPDRPPLPPDDPAAFQYMKRADGHRNFTHWSKRGDAPWIEDPEWQHLLQLTSEGVLKLTAEQAVEVGLLNSREYQTQLETLYESALRLTLDRYEFALHWFLTNDTTWTHFGSSADESNTLTTSSTGGFTKNLVAGGQLMVELANKFVFEFAGPDHTTVQSNILINFMQPLLRGFGQNVRMEILTQGERNLLYQVRTFAHFRKNFTFLVFTSRYLNLLSQQQQIINQQSTLESLQQNYRLHQALFASGIVSSVKVDQVFQGVLSGRLSLIQAQAALQNAFDNYKLILGLPPTLPITLDDSVLAPFQLTDPALATLQGDADALQAAYRELDQAPPLVKLKEGYTKAEALYDRLNRLVAEVEGEIADWKKKLAEPDEDQERHQRAQDAQVKQAEAITTLRGEMTKLRQAIETNKKALTEATRDKGWKDLLVRISDVSSAAGELFVIQTQVRVYLIKLRPMKFKEGPSISYAFDHRLDLMNQRGAVVDAWRNIGVSANLLEADLNVLFNANIATPPDGNNPVGFRASASSYSVGVQFAAPLDRLVARNAYRTSQITYEQARRDFMALEDQIASSIRTDLRNLNTAALSFEIARQTLISAARSVESAREELLFAATPDPTSTQNVLNALDNVLSAKNNLISTWVSYEVGRIQLLLDMEALQLDERGLYTNESDDPLGQPGTATDCANAPEQCVPL
jgi:outer membrane protein TolC